MTKISKYGIDEDSIWSIEQNHPELVVKDCIKEFNLNEEQADKLRFILLKRGVNKWLYNRYQFIRLKHETKAMYKQDKSNKQIEYIHSKLQNICKNPRWIEWPTKVSSKMKTNITNCKIYGKHC